MTYLLLFYEFFKAGLFAIGGGLATIPFLLKIMEKYPLWFGTMTLADIVAIAESTPGPVGVNAATFAGYTAAGVGGALIATLGVVLPSFIVISLIAGALQKYRSNRYINDAFEGLRPAVTGLIGAAFYSVFKMAIIRGNIETGILNAIDWRCMILFVILFACTQLPKIKSIHPIFYILAGAAAGLALGL